MSTIEQAVPKMSDSIKRLCAGLINSQQLPAVYIGTVTSVDPLSISLTSQNVLSSRFLILTNAVKDHDVDISVSWNTVDNTHQHGNGNDGQDTSPTTHNHGIQGRKKITIHNGLTAGEKVLLLRVQGGQSYVVVDRLSEIQTTGESV